MADFEVEIGEGGNLTVQVNPFGATLLKIGSFHSFHFFSFSFGFDTSLF